MYEYKATLLKVIDADTLDVNVDLGFGIWHQLRVRLFGIDCPERFTDQGKAATAFVEAWFADGLPITLQTFKDRQEKYGRYLARVITAKGDLVMALREFGFEKELRQ